MTVPTPFREAFSDDDEAEAVYRRLLINAGFQRSAGVCVGPHCISRPARGALTCNRQPCIEFVMAAPLVNIAHWQGMDTPEEGTAADWRAYFLAGILGGAMSGGLVIAAFAVGIWFRWLRIVA